MEKYASAVTSTNKDFDRNSALQAACDISIWIPQVSGFVPRNAGYTVSVRRIRLDVLVLLTLALVGESPTCILHEGIHTCNTRDRSITRSLQRKLSFDQNFFFGRTHS